MTDVLFHRLRVREVRAETDDSRSLVFDLAPDQVGPFHYRPGQFLTLRIPGHDGAVARCYSLSSSPEVDPHPKVTVKRVAGGYGSNWVCDHVTTGTELDALEPAGAFTPRSFDEDLLLFAGGSGITPIISIVKSALVAGTARVVLVYANRDDASIIFGDELAVLAAEHPERLLVLHWLESAQGLPSAAALHALIAPYDYDQAFLCGPQPFMRAARKALRDNNFPRTGLHLERFASLTGDPFVDARPAGPTRTDRAGGTTPLDTPHQPDQSRLSDRSRLAGRSRQPDQAQQPDRARRSAGSEPGETQEPGEARSSGGHGNAGSRDNAAVPGSPQRVRGSR